MSDRVTIVLPTFNRAGALERNLDSLLAVEGVSEILIVDDGSADRTPAALTLISDPRVRVLRHERNRGQAAARNTGVLAADADWIMFGEDDCRFPHDYALKLLGGARRLEADIVSAPFVHLDVPEAEVAAAVANLPRTRQPATNHMTNAFPLAPAETPFLPARALVRRSVFDSVRFDEGYRGNAFREETDFFVSAARHGFRCYLIPDTYNYQIEHWGGGARLPRLAYEYWCLHNNWRFLQRHGDWLREHGLIHSASTAQLALVWSRFVYVATGSASARLKRLLARDQQRQVDRA
jgi:glycosyltransferase involved in cell wall biosynthesis